jgi:phosphate transport system permease protein
MQSTTLILLLGFMAIAAFYFGRGRSLSLVGGPGHGMALHSLPGLWMVIEPRLIISMVVSGLPESYRSLPAGELNLLVNNIQNLASGDVISVDADEMLQAAAARFNAYAVNGGAHAWRQIHPDLRARNRVERVVRWFLIAASSIAIFTTVGIVLSVLFEAIRFFQKVPMTEFLFGLNWSPQMAIRADQVGSSGSFGAVPLFTGTLLIIYLAEYSSSRVRGIAKPLLEVLAGIPTVVYGFFAALTVAPWVRRAGESVGFEVASESALAAGLVMGIMIIPLVSSLADDAINAVPTAMRDGALGLGSTRSETMTKVILPAALPGIVGGILLAVSRAIGETMIVVMAAGLAANLTANPFEAVTTVTVQIVTLLVGDQEFDSAKTLAAFALGLMLFIVTLFLNVMGIVFLGVFFSSLIAQSATAFKQTFLKLEIELTEDVLAPGGELDLTYADFDGLVRAALRAELPEVSSRSDRRELYRIVSIGAGYQVRDLVAGNPELLGTTQTLWVPASSNVDMLIKGNIDSNLDESLRPMSDKQVEWVRRLQEAGRLETRFNRALFTNGDSREPELAGIKGAVMGSLYMLIVTIVLSFPIGVAAAIYLEEFAPRNRWSDEVNINNLAAVPSIVFGLLGLAVFINWAALPRSAPLVGGLVLTLLTLPVIPRFDKSRAAVYS